MFNTKYLVRPIYLFTHYSVVACHWHRRHIVVVMLNC